MYTKKAPVSELREADRVEDIFVVKIKKPILPYANGFRFQLILSDASGRSIDYSYWGDQNEDAVRRIHDSIKSDSVVFVQGRVANFNKKLQISTNLPDTIKVLNEGEFDPSEFIRPAQRDIGEMVSELKNRIAGVQNPEIRAVLEMIFTDDFMQKFSVHPGAIEIHHNWKGGLLQHTLEVVKYCETSKHLFGELDTDLMMAGALLHDIGKLYELTTSTRIKGTPEGQLKGHIAMGYGMVHKATEELGTSGIIRDKLLHMMLSHHGIAEYGSPKSPMFPEALAVNYADEMSSKISEIVDFVKDSKEATEDDFMFHKRKGHNIYLR